MTTDRGSVKNPWPVGKVVSQEQLNSMPVRTPNFKLESQILHQLALQATQNPGQLLQAMADIVAPLYTDVSICISLYGANENLQDRWVAVSSSGGHWLRAGVGEVLFPQEIIIHQALPIPLHRQEARIGTMWVLSHASSTAFDQEDVRFLTSISAFGGVAVTLSETPATPDHEKLYDHHKSLLAKISHDMRSPLSAIIGFSDLLSGKDLTLEQRSQFISVIGRNADELLRMIDEILHSSKKENSKNSLDTSEKVLAGVRVLVVDDLVDNRGLLGILLKSAGASVDCAGDGAEGAAKALAKSYDVIVMDIQMPVMDGYEALDKIREQKCLTPAIALTANATVGQREIAVAKGFHGFLNKPIQRDDFIELIAQLATPEGFSAADASTPVASIALCAEKSGPSILIVEDDLDVRELIEFVSTEAGAQVRLANSGKEALQVLENGLKPDLIFLDFTLPDLDGAEVMTIIRKDPRWQKIKVILLSGHDNLVERAKQIGADGALLKPFDVDQIEHLISNYSAI